MKRQKSLLLVDRNRSMREFLRREFEADGYYVRAAGTGTATCEILDGGQCPDLLIIDVDLPLVVGLDILARVQNRIPPLPVVVHSFFTEFMSQPAPTCVVGLIEKSEDLEQLKKAIADVFEATTFSVHRTVRGNETGAR